VPPTCSANDLFSILAPFQLVIAEAFCEVQDVAVPDYPDGPRPSSIITLRGAGERGHGELVAWTRAAHEDFAARVRDIPRGAVRLGEWSAAVGKQFQDPYERAALEAAALDLALLQHGTNLFRLTGAAPKPVRYVVSFGRAADPLPLVAREPADTQLKIDVDPAWSDGTWAALAELGRVAVLDFKGSASAVDLERALRILPDALVEDPGPAADLPVALRARLSADAPLTSADALDALPVRPAAANVKPARMGGVLEALACVARCEALGIETYFGGMFEVGSGRRQLRDLAALLTPDGPNDIAPLAVAERPAPRPARLEVDSARPGFGA
jgi:L-alanine-DL-glutamate epimerase-like enolase superfamily enzyme